MITCNILFSGIGAQEAALKRLGLDFEVVGISEIDKYAIQSYEAINGPVRNYGDITQIERLDYADLWTYSFCCQDISQAGKQKGFVNADGSLTRSGLLKHVERLLTDSVLFGTQPKYLLLENVKALVSKKFMPDFQRWLDKLEQLGYNNYWQVLNAKDYGIPQNRERVFVVSIRKNIDTKGYKFPSPVPLEKRLKDILEPYVDEKYYLSADKVAKFLQNGNTNPSGKGINGNVCTGDICNTLTTNKGEGLKIKEVSNTVRCGGGGGLEPKILEEGVGLNPLSRKLEFNGFKENCPSLRATDYKCPHCYSDGYRIRKLTPRECWRLMAFTDVEFDCAKLSGVSDSRLYQQAGNSIVVDVLVGIFRELFNDRL